MNQYAIQGILPDLTIHLDLNAEDGIRRKKDQAELDRMELETMEFHKKVADGYRQLAKRAPERMKTIDATLPIEEIQERIIQFVENMLSLEK